MNATLKLAAVALFSALFCSPAPAQNCGALPKGPQKAQCIRQNKPQVLDRKLERCKALAVERGSATRGGGAKDFIRSCMRGQVPS